MVAMPSTRSFHLHPYFKEVLMTLYEYYTTRMMLEPLVPGMNTNNLGNVNAVILANLGKIKVRKDCLRI